MARIAAGNRLPGPINEQAAALACREAGCLGWLRCVEERSCIDIIGQRALARPIRDGRSFPDPPAGLLIHVGGTEAGGEASNVHWLQATRLNTCSLSRR